MSRVYPALDPVLIIPSLFTPGYKQTPYSGASLAMNHVKLQG